MIDISWFCIRKPYSTSTFKFFVSEKSKKFREIISPVERLVLTVRYLALGDSQLYHWHTA